MAIVTYPSGYDYLVGQNQRTTTSPGQVIPIVNVQNGGPSPASPSSFATLRAHVRDRFLLGISLLAARPP